MFFFYLGRRRSSTPPRRRRLSRSPRPRRSSISPCIHPRVSSKSSDGLSGKNHSKPRRIDLKNFCEDNLPEIHVTKPERGNLNINLFMIAREWCDATVGEMQKRGWKKMTNCPWSCAKFYLIKGRVFSSKWTIFVPKSPVFQMIYRRWFLLFFMGVGAFERPRYKLFCVSEDFFISRPKIHLRARKCSISEIKKNINFCNIIATLSPRLINIFVMGKNGNIPHVILNRKAQFLVDCKKKIFIYQLQVVIQVGIFKCQFD